MKPIALLFGMAVCGLLLGGCAKKHTLSAYYPSATEYLNTEGDGSLTLRAYGMGKNKVDAIEQARKNAVQAVLFKGVRVPGNALLSRPLVTEVNGEEKYQYFFYPFFRDGGEFARFVTAEDRRSRTDVVERTSTQVKCATTVRVLRQDLQRYLVEHNILKP